MIKEKIREFITKNQFIIGVLVGTFLTISAIFLAAFVNNKVGELNPKDEASILNNMKILNKYNEKFTNENFNDVRFVKDFSLEENTFSFKNFTDIYSSGGNCAGIVLTEMLAFNSSFQNEEIRTNVFKDNEFNPKISLGEYSINEENKERFEIFRSQNISPDVLYDKSKDNPKILVDYKDVFNNVDLANIFNLISYFQINQKNYKQPYNIPQDKFDLEKEILSKIDNNETVGVSLSNKVETGHAILAYGYKKLELSKEETNSNIAEAVRVFVGDSNIPIKKNSSNEENEAYNNSAKESSILFLKMDGIWHYIYNPTIPRSNDNSQVYVYKGVYNSFIPQSQITIYSVKK